VTIRGTFKKDSRPSNGLETIAGELIADKHGQHYVVGVVKWAGGNLNEEGELVPAAKFLAIEPLTGAAVDAAKRILDDARRARGLGRAEDDFAKPADPTLFDFDGPDDGEPRQVGEVRLTGDGPREVPEPSAEEIQAERAESKAAKAKPTTTPFEPDGAA
jgi:hypothetical protein